MDSKGLAENEPINTGENSPVILYECTGFGITLSSWTPWPYNVTKKDLRSAYTMDRLLVFLAVIGSLAILCQWYVIACIRKYLLQRYRKVTRKTAYTILAILGVFNVLSVRVAIHSEFLPLDTLAGKVAAVLFFSYLGCVLTLTLYFLVLGLVYHALRLKDVLFVKSVPPLATEAAICGQRGCVHTGCAAHQRDAAIPGCKAEPGVLDRTALSSALPVPNEANIPQLPPSRRAFLKWTAAAGVVAVSGFAGRGVAEGYQAPVVPVFHLSHPALEGASRPLSFIQITDFHFGLFLGSEELERLINMVNAIDADAVFMTGDMFHSPMSPVEHATPILAKIRPRRLGNFAVLGNHDFYAGEWRSVQSLQESGWTILRNRWTTFTDGSARIHLGGIDDPMVNWAWGTKFPNFPLLMDRAPRTPGLRILLSHRPHVLPLAANAGIDLVCAGHIHGGQIIFPVPGTDRGISLAAVASPYTHGWYTSGETRMYLSRGCGLTFVPWRINCPPEISVFHVHPPLESTRRVSKTEPGAERGTDHFPRRSA
jgi:uncharacterized protein